MTKTTRDRGARASTRRVEGSGGKVALPAAPDDQATDDESAADEEAMDDESAAEGEPSSRRRRKASPTNSGCLPVHPDDKIAFADRPVDERYTDSGVLLWEGWSKDSRVGHRRVRAHVSTYYRAERLWIRGWYLSADAFWRPSREAFYLSARDARRMADALTKAQRRIEREDVRRFGRSVGEHRLEAGGGCINWHGPQRGATRVVFRIPYRDVADLLYAVRTFVARVSGRPVELGGRVATRQPEPVVALVARENLADISAHASVAESSPVRALRAAAYSPNPLAPEDPTRARVGTLRSTVHGLEDEGRDLSTRDLGRRTVKHETTSAPTTVGFDLSGHESGPRQAGLFPTQRAPQKRQRRETQAQVLVRKFYAALRAAGLVGPARIEWATDVRLARGLIEGFRRSLLDPDETIDSFVAAVVANPWFKTRTRPDFRLAVRISESIVREISNGQNLNAPQFKERRDLIAFVRTLAERADVERGYREAVNRAAALDVSPSEKWSLAMRALPTEVDYVVQFYPDGGAYQFLPAGMDRLTADERKLMRYVVRYELLLREWRRAWGVVGVAVPDTFAALRPRRVGIDADALRRKCAGE